MASFSSLVQSFAVAPTTCGSLVSNAKMYFVRLRDCDREPSTFTIAFTTAIAIGDVVAALSLTAPVTVPATSMFLKKGTRIYRASGIAPYVEYVQLAQNVTLVQGVPQTGIAIEPALAVIASAATAQQLEVIPLSSARNVPVDFQVKSDDNKRTSDGLKGRSTITNIAPQIQTELFYDLDDASVFADGFLFDSFQAGAELYVVRFSSGGEGFLAGAAKISALSETDEVDATAKLSTTLMFQDNYYLAKPYRYQSVAQKAATNEIRRGLGLPQLV